MKESFWRKLTLLDVDFSKVSDDEVIPCESYECARELAVRGFKNPVNPIAGITSANNEKGWISNAASDWFLSPFQKLPPHQRVFSEYPNLLPFAGEVGDLPDPNIFRMNLLIDLRHPTARLLNWFERCINAERRARGITPISKTTGAGSAQRQARKNLKLLGAWRLLSHNDGNIHRTQVQTRFPVGEIFGRGAAHDSFWSESKKAGKSQIMKFRDRMRSPLCFGLFAPTLFQ